jgi:uncharacterized Zn-binding protein involved in type VI secretion
MASTYTSRINLELQADGENPNSWGDILNNNVIQLVDDAVAAYTSVTLSSTDYTLTTNDGSTDQARSAMLEIVGTVSSDSNLIIPGVSKFYIVKDKSVRQNDAAIKIKTAAGSGFTVAASATRVVICDSVSVYGTDGLGATVCVTNLFAQTGNFTACVSTTNLVAVTGSFTTKVSGVAAEFSGEVCAATGSFSACVSTTNLVAATGSFTTKVSGVAAEFSGAVCAAEFYGDGSNLTNVAGTLANSNFTRDTTAVSATTTFPMTRAPAVDEGTEIVTCTITPTNSSNLLRITATANLQKAASSDYAIMGLFRDTDSWSFASQWFGVDNSATPVAGTIMAQVTAGSTSSTVFKLRMATNTGHWASNVGLAGTALAGETLGGTVGNTMLVEEIKV